MALDDQESNGSSGNCPEDGAAPSAGRRRTQAQIKSDKEWEASLWAKWPREEDWPAVQTVYQAAAYWRVHHDTVRRLLATGRDGKARLQHRKVGGVYRIRRADLDAYGLVSGR